MKILRKAILPFAILPFQHLVYAQKKDSIPIKVRAFVADKFPQARDFNVEFTQNTPYKFSSALRGNDLPENKVKDFHQVKANANIYLLKSKNWLVSTSLNYRFTSINTENSVSAYSQEKNFHYHSESINASYSSKLFNKIAIYSASVSVDGSEQHFERIRGMFTGAILLKANQKTKMTVGVVAFIDPSSQIPAFPLFTYEHKFDNGWVADIILPKKILVRKNVFSNGRISFGSEMDNTSFYHYISGKTYEYRQVEINSGAIYEHNLGGNFIGTLKTGIRATPNARVFEKQESFKDYIFEAKYKPSFYFNIGVSYNPFGKPRTKQ
ncbi:hypothetical protein JI747_013285 [Chryseobacterium sp. RG1]|uniref:Outer membrane protein beta-barrel family protein n=1 Tax=Chryseobacterium tagetis TaxID=2801334 RepID=A0ABS8A3Z2_9FLAO|nr:hypothetical protein [Chryseobacterium tagetis]MCA6068163.1 hypothetical protein [Chryseobacterium tagetis]